MNVVALVSFGGNTAAVDGVVFHAATGRSTPLHRTLLETHRPPRRLGAAAARPRHRYFGVLSQEISAATPNGRRRPK
jgi:hypothetical protein